MLVGSFSNSSKLNSSKYTLPDIGSLKYLFWTTILNLSTPSLAVIVPLILVQSFASLIVPILLRSNTPFLLSNCSTFIKTGALVLSVT